jgi:hypothetical protein
MAGRYSAPLASAVTVNSTSGTEKNAKSLSEVGSNMGEVGSNMAVIWAAAVMQAAVAAMQAAVAAMQAAVVAIGELNAGDHQREALHKKSVTEAKSLSLWERPTRREARAR